MSTDVLEAPAPSGKDATYAARRQLIQGSARATLKRRRAIALAIRIIFGICMFLTLIPLAFLIGYVTKRGIGALSVAFFTHTPTPEGIPGGGISNAIVGSLIINGLALVIAMPIGLLVALFLIERRGPIANAIRFGADVLSGLPSILIGLFAYSVIVVHTHYSAYSASVALAVLMLPIMIRGNEEAMRTVPNELWEAGLALGLRRWRIVLRIVLPTAAGGLVTGAVLGVARVAGETAPLLLTSSIFSNLGITTNPGVALPNIPVTIFTLSESPSPQDHAQAWAAALVLVAFVLIVSLVARTFNERSRRKIAD